MNTLNLWSGRCRSVAGAMETALGIASRLCGLREEARAGLREQRAEGLTVLGGWEALRRRGFR